MGSLTIMNSNITEIYSYTVYLKGLGKHKVDDIIKEPESTSRIDGVSKVVGTC
jgi:hypothetical protein